MPPASDRFTPPSPAGSPPPAADPPSMRAAIAAFDWSATPLGARADWPASLRAIVDMMLSSRIAMCLGWGRDLTVIYNDAYAAIIAGRRDDRIGRPVREVWGDVWVSFAPLIDEALAGRPMLLNDILFRTQRGDVSEDTWWSFGFSPLHDESGAVAGFLDCVTEVTERVQVTRRLEQETQRLRDSEARFRALAATGADVIYRMSPDWRELRMLEGRGLLADTSSPSTDWTERYLLPSERDAVLAQAADALRDRRALEMEHRVRRADGSIGWARSRAVPMLDRDGTLVEWFGFAHDVTREHEARAALAAHRERLELATRAARLGQFDYAPQQGRLDWDDRCRELFGLPPGAPVSYEDAFVLGLHPDDRAAATAAVMAALDPTGSRLFDVGYRTIGLTDGVERHIRARGIAMFENDVPVRLIGTVQDVTAERRAEGALRETEERLRLANRATNDAIWDWDLVRDQVLWNEALTTAYGHAPEAIEGSGQWWLDHIHPDDRARIDRSIHAVIDGSGSAWTDDYRFRRADGSYADVRDRGFVIRDGEGRATRMIGAMLDQTERKERERSLQEAVAERTRERDQIWQASPDLLCVVTPEGRYRELNPAWQDTLGWRVADLAGQAVTGLVHDDDRAAIEEALAALARGERVAGLEVRYRTRDGGHRWLSWHAVPRDGMIYAVLRDVTAGRQQSAALALAEEQLRQSQKMEAVGQLTGGIAHDFNNLLTGVIGSLELVRRFIADGRMERVDRYIDAAATSAQRAAGLTQRLLAFSRRQSLDVRAVDVNHAVASVEDLLRRTLGEDIALDLALAADAGAATTDANQLESALLNLAINARDAMPDGGRLTIATERRRVERGEIGGTDAPEPGDYIAVSVADTGIGMSADTIAKAFDPFFTTKPIGHGTGLGLSMIYGFARQTGGHARIVSQPGEGTTVTLLLRRAAPDAVVAAPLHAATPVAIDAGAGVLLVEDDPAVRMLAVEVLEQLGCRVIQAVDGHQAIALLDTRPDIRLLVTDVGLPGVNGRAVADHARATMPGLKVLFVTGYAEQARVRSGFLDDGMELMTKPFAVDAFAAQVARMLATTTKTTSAPLSVPV
ncbi:PAS domain-containing protein [Sphingomonas adhaesiva]|uniref:PAS domain-containing protein n=1 Tax=Sphingomonas adhaesiva TaxID=28212 RepID=UPI002FFA5B9E